MQPHHFDQIKAALVVASMGSAPVWLGTLNEALAVAVGAFGVVYGFFKAWNEIAAWRTRRAAGKD